MPGPRQVLRLRLRVDRRKNRDRAVRGTDAGGNPKPSVDRFAKRRSMHGGIDWRHQRKVQLVAAILGERQANQSSRILGHEVDGFRRNLLRRHRQVAFVFAVLIIDQDNHVPLSNILHRLFHGRKVSSHLAHIIELYHSCAFLRMDRGREGAFAKSPDR